MLACALSGVVLHVDIRERPQVVCMLSILPLAFFLGSQSQFGRLNPVNPRDYVLLARKALRALRENDLKVRSSQRCRLLLLRLLGASLRCHIGLRRSPARTSDRLRFLDGGGHANMLGASSRLQAVRASQQNMS